MSDKKYYTHPTAIVESKNIKPKTRIWAFCNIQSDVIIGEDCNIGDHCSIESGVKIGDRVTIKNGVSLWNGMTIEDDVFVGPNAVFTNDIYPRSKAYHKEPDLTIVKKGATIGANAVIIAGNTIGIYAIIGAGSVITKNIPDFTIWYGNPAVMKGYVCFCSKHIVFNESNNAVCECGKCFILKNNLVISKL
jgi:acetyltransferase-like isoleucine patch superfamily enzyme